MFHHVDCDSLDDPYYNEFCSELCGYNPHPAHEECGENWRGGCRGWMCNWENPHTGNTRLLCAEHADEAELRQAQIQRDFLNDSVYSADY
jgi:hypothetical protein